jgi:phage regulator Rha-like protein
MTEEALLEDAPLVFTGHVTPLSLYREVYERSQTDDNFVVVFDDVDALMTNKSNIAILKQLCDTRETKTIKYFSSTLRDIPQEFETKVKVLMLVNSLETDDKNLRALFTRAHVLHFDPVDIEVLNNMKTFADDKTILNYIHNFAPFSKSLNLRVYKRAEELKKSGLPWQQEIIESLDIDLNLYNVFNLLKKYKTDKEREKEFDGSRTTYYRYKKLLLSKVPELK